MRMVASSECVMRPHAVRARRLVVLLAALTALVLTACAPAPRATPAVHGLGTQDPHRGLHPRGLNISRSITW
jgi:hypothetical protein